MTATTTATATSSDRSRNLEERLLRYVQIDTASDESSPASPSTAKQFDLLNLLVDELKEILALIEAETASEAVAA